ncbi:F1F0 ATPase subunit 2 [Caballeronia udeis]|jgi:F1F0 ATPase subunit 2|uniref:F1F0 ATPase subunit 2 n=1 Tax=Caballeronia udeis TaxID=1232866 RepID=A0ABW8MRC0_9BURK
MTYQFPLAAQIAIGVGVGLAAGAIHFATLRWNVRLLIAGTPVKAIGLQLLRLAGVAILFGILAKLGAWPLLCGAAGLLLARSVILRRVQVTP